MRCVIAGHLGVCTPDTRQILCRIRMIFASGLHYLEFPVKSEDLLKPRLCPRLGRRLHPLLEVPYQTQRLLVHDVGDRTVRPFLTVRPRGLAPALRPYALAL